MSEVAPEVPAKGFGWGKPLALGLAAALFTWFGLSAALRLMQNQALPQVSLRTLGGSAAELATLAAGKPTVVNLWATWCPPCRRELPTLAAAQQREAAMNFVFVDQGEDAATVTRYLSSAKLELSNVMLDPASKLGRELGSTALPITLFYDANGRMVDTHLGALSESTLEGKLARVRAASKP